MRKINPDKLKPLSTFNDKLDKLHGLPEREKFDEESLAWFNDTAI